MIFSSKVHCGLFPAEDFLLCGECSRHVWLLLDTGPYNKLLLFDISHFFWTQALTAILGGAFALVLLPETKDKTFTELEHIFSHSSQKDRALV